jgi:hypothetical protein
MTIFGADYKPHEIRADYKPREKFAQALANDGAISISLLSAYENAKKNHSII